VQYARATGARVIAVDAGDEKGEMCKQLGAEEYIDFTKTENVEDEVRRITTHGGESVPETPQCCR
jgi:alcohol dehydrogenase, propanol-preferring